MVELTPTTICKAGTEDNWYQEGEGLWLRLGLCKVSLLKYM